MRQRQSASQRSVRCVHVDTTRLDTEQEFQLSAMVQPDGTKIYRLQSSQDMEVTSPLYDLVTDTKLSQAHFE